MGDLSKRAMLEQILARDGLISDKVDRILAALSGPRFRFKVGPVETRNLSQQGTFDMALTITDIQKVPYTLQEKDAAGNPVPTSFATPPTWTTSDPTILTVTPSADGTSAVVESTGKLGTAQVRADMTNDAGEPIIGLADLEIVVSAGTTVELVAGTPVNK